MGFGYIPEGPIETLGAKLKPCTGSVYDHSQGDFERCIRNFFQCLVAGPDFLSTLTRSQRAIFNLIEEWYARQQKEDGQMTAIKRRLLGVILWEHCYHAQDFHLEGLQGLIPAAELDNLHALRAEFDQTGDAEGSLSLEIGHIIKEAHDTQAMLKRISGHRMYDFKLLLLLIVEFNGLNWSPPGAVWGTRYDAVMVAAAERIGLHCLHHALERPRNPQGGDAGAGLQLKDCQNMALSIWEPCHWLNQAKDRNDSAGQLPYYLWDIEGECTIETAGLSDPNIAYSTVSHTWGRWRKAGDGASLPGVPEWRVPENELFEVRELPSILKRVGFSERYVWLDLLCIPQDTVSDNGRLAAICQEELARQATIFRCAATSVAWLNDVASWRGTEAVITWIGLNYLRDQSPPAPVTGKIPEPDDIIIAALSQVEASMPDSCGLVTYVTRTAGPGEPDPDPEMRVPGWFSSLWTLQESMMRPDMLLVNEQWEPLRVGGGSGAHTGMSVTLLTAHIYLIKEKDKKLPPLAFHELSNLMMETGMLGLHQADRLTPLVLARSRACTHSRVTAIMSVTGATDWHRGRKAEQFRADVLQGEEEDLVCGLYPLAFVDELRGVVGGSFFTYNNSVATLTTTDGVDRALPGAMLPFMPGPPDHTRIVTDTIVVPRHTDHPAVRGWTIRTDGSVCLPAVGIVASSVAGYQDAAEAARRRSGACAPGPALIQGNDPLDSTRTDSVSDSGRDLLAWLRSFRGEAHAVCTMASRMSRAGIILHRLRPGVGPFVKAGVFGTEEDEPVEPQTSPVYVCGLVCAMTRGQSLDESIPLYFYLSGAASVSR